MTPPHQAREGRAIRPGVTLKNLARGGNSFHDHRSAILRIALERDPGTASLGKFLQKTLFKTRRGWRAFAFNGRDWDLADRLMVGGRPEYDGRMLSFALAYVKANSESVARMYALADEITGQILTMRETVITVPTDAMTPEEWQSGFGLKIIAATNEQSPDAMRAALESSMAGNEWCRSRLLYPLINRTINRTSPENIGNLLDYFMSGGERASEKAALRLLLHHDAARSTPLAFKLFVGLMGHPFDACEILVDHVELAFARDGRLDPASKLALDTLAELLPNSRVGDLAALTTSPVPAASLPTGRLGRYGLGPEEETLLADFATLGPFTPRTDMSLRRPLGLLADMRSSTYPAPDQFRDLVAAASVWSFVDGGRLVGALMRSLYLVDRTGTELEGRDALRLASLYGRVDEFIATAPSAVPALRRVMPAVIADRSRLAAIEGAAASALEDADPDQRLWISRLQWRLRALEEAGLVQQWLETVRAEARIRPLYLTGINWPWVDELLARQRLKPFRSFDGAYLLLIAAMEGRDDPLLLKLVLDKLLRGQSAQEVVETLIGEYGEYAPAFVTRYLTTANLLTSGRAANHLAALNQRLVALENCIRRLGYNSALTREMYEAESKVMTTELLLLNVNAGKFEVPWDLFSSNAEDKHRDQWETFGRLRHSMGEEALSAFVDTPRVFRNGHKEEYRYRRNDAVLFLTIVQLIEDFLDHPAFGLEIILSGRFRHNNLLQELHGAIATVANSTIHPVVPANTRKLAAPYRGVVERGVFQWCSRALQTRRKDKPEALFHLIPTSAEVMEIIGTLDDGSDLSDVVMAVVAWIKDKLRIQVEHAGKAFANEMKLDVERSFARVLQEQLDGCDQTYRPEDARRVNKAVLDAVLRRIETLETWFDGVDSRSVAPVSLAQLAQATETLFENVLPDRELRTDTDGDAAVTMFEPEEVKVAFDLVREVAFNALKHGSAPKVRLTIRKDPTATPTTFIFSNPSAGAQADGEVAGEAYDSEDEALRREGNSGRLKIAASAATLLGRDLAICWAVREGQYELTVPMRAATHGEG